MTDPVGVVVPLVCCTFAVRVTGEFSATLEALEEREVVVPITAELAFTVKLNVALCTRSPLIAQSVTGTVRVVVAEEAVKVRIENPLVRFGTLKDAVTPAGSPETLRLTVPKLKEFTRTVAVARPEDIV